MKRKAVFYFLQLIVFLTVIPAGYAGVYKWVDEKGNVHYGDKPKDTDAEQMRIPSKKTDTSSGSSDQNRLQYQRKLLEAMTKERRDKEMTQAKAKEEAEKNKRKCRKAKNELHDRRHSRYVYRLDKNGERVILSDEERRAGTEKMEALIKKHCG